MRAVPLLVCVTLLAGCTSESDDHDGGVASVAGVKPDADGDVDLTAEDGLELERGNASLTVRLGDVLQVDVVQACAGECVAMEVPKGALVATTALISLKNISLNAIGPEGDSAVFFYDDGRETGRFLRWSEVQSRFQMNADLLALGNLSATGHVGSITILTLPGGQLVTVSSAALEGFERAIFARGTAVLLNGSATVTLPPEFVAVAEPDGHVTVQVTPLAPGLDLHVESKGTESFTVLGKAGVFGRFDWFLQAPRRGHEQYEP